MNHCRDCRYWHKTYDGTKGQCMKAESVTDGTPADPDTKAYAFGLHAADRAADLVTEQDFGCVMWQPEPKEMPF